MGKGWQATILKFVAAETIYEVWKHRNEKISRHNINNMKIEEKSIGFIMYRGWINQKLRKYKLG